MSESQGSGSGFILAFVFAICLILVGVVMMNMQVSGVDTHLDKIETKVDTIGNDVQMLKYGQQLLAASSGKQEPVIVTVK